MGEGKGLQLPKALIVILLLTEALLAGTLLYLVVGNYTRSQEAAPVIVDDFLSEYLGSRDIGVEPDAIPGYFQDGWDDKERSKFFEEVFVGYRFGHTDYEIEHITHGFVCIRLFGDGKLQPPPVGFWYRLSLDGSKITKWRLGRLMPFSHYDEEYSEVWDGVYQ